MSAGTIHHKRLSITASEAKSYLLMQMGTLAGQQLLEANTPYPCAEDLPKGGTTGVVTKPPRSAGLSASRA